MIKDQSTIQKVLSSGLLTAKTFGDGDFFAYRYDSAGRLALAVGPTGEALSLETSVFGCEDHGEDPALCVKIIGQVEGHYAVHQSGLVRILPPMKKGKSTIRFL